MNKRKKIWIACGALAILAVIVISSVKSLNRNAIVVQVSKAERIDVLTSVVSASGDIRAKEFVDLQSEIAGIITDLPVREGDAVKKGDVLLKIDPIQTAADMNASRAQHEASLAEARAQQFLIMNAEANLLRDEAALRSARAELELAQNNFIRQQSSFRRRQQLNEEGLISRDDYEAAQNDFKTAQARLEVAKADVAQKETQIRVARNNIEQNKSSAEANLARAKSSEASLTKASDQLKKTTLVSPLNGVITQLLVEKGERAQPGIMSNPEATLMTIADLSVIQAELKVDETDIVSLTLGDSAKVTVDALPDEVFEGEVSEIGNSPIRTSGQEAKDFKVVITLKDPSPKIRPGMSCTGEITTDTRHDVLVVPIQALTIREVEVDDNGIYHEPDLSRESRSSVARAESENDDIQKAELEGVFVINSENIARFRPIKTGITGESDIEVLENLEDDEEIITGSFQTLRTIKDGTRVKPDTTDKSSS